MASIVRPFVVDRVMKRRGKVHLFESLPPRETALVVIDMQNTFMKPGGAVEVPASRELVDPINDLAETVRSRGGLVVWIAHANNVLPAEGTNDWSSFTNRFVGGEMRTRTAQSLAPGAEGQKLWGDLRVHQNDLVIQKNRYSALIQGSSQLERILRSSGRTTILLAGTKTDVRLSFPPFTSQFSAGLCRIDRARRDDARL